MQAATVGNPYRLRIPLEENILAPTQLIVITDIFHYGMLFASHLSGIAIIKTAAASGKP